MKVDGADDPSRRRSRRLNLKALHNWGINETSLYYIYFQNIWHSKVAVAIHYRVQKRSQTFSLNVMFSGTLFHQYGISRRYFEQTVKISSALISMRWTTNHWATSWMASCNPQSEWWLHDSHDVIYVTLQHKTSCMGQILESEILQVICDSVLLSTNIFDIIIYAS
jgi:hypothetical protein